MTPIVSAASLLPPATGADLSLTMTADNVTAPAQRSTGTVTIPGGGFITIGFSVTNSGPADATNVEIMMTFIGGITGKRTLALATLATAGTQRITATDTATSSITGSQTGIAVAAAPPTITAISPTWSLPDGRATVTITVTVGGQTVTQANAFTYGMVSPRPATGLIGVTGEGMPRVLPTPRP